MQCLFTIKKNITMINESQYVRELRKEELSKANAALEQAKKIEKERMKKGWKYMYLDSSKVLVKPEMFDKKIKLGFNFCE